MASDAENRQLKQDIIRCLGDQEHSLSIFKEQIKNKDVIVFLGNTRSGKSTLVNYIIGAELEAWESGKMEFKIREVEADWGPSIGQGSLSCTSLPGVYRVSGNADVVVVDPPGFEDNRGIIQDIINALCISQIKVARTVKFILVFDINEITNDNIRNFTNSLQQVQALVSNFDELKRSFAVVFTKDWRSYTQSEIAEFLRNKILNVEQFDINKVLLRNLVDNDKFIGIFQMPKQSGRISAELDVNIKGAIAACHSVDVEKCQILFALSDKAQEALLQIYPEYTDTNFFEDEINRLTARYNNYFDVDKYIFASYDNELAAVRTAMENISSDLQTHRDAVRMHLHQIQASLDELLKDPVSQEFRANFKFVVMLDWSSMLEERCKQMILTNYVNSLSKLFDKIARLLEKIYVEQDERTKNKIIFCIGSAAGGIGMGPALAGAGKMLDCVVKAGSSLKNVTTPAASIYTGCEAVIGGTMMGGLCIAGAAVAGAGAGSAYVLYKQTYGKRIEARREQNRD